MIGGVTTIGPTSVAVPEHVLTQADVKEAVRALLKLAPERLEAVLSLFDGAGVDRRFSVLPVAGLHQQRDLSETMAIYREHALGLSRKVASDCLRKAGVAPDAIDLVISVSCTGVMLPSLEVYLANELGFRSDVRRLPITELGCMGGAAALSHARDFITGHPDANVLVLCVELPTLSFQRHDLSPANIISTAIFGDGAAAVLLTGREIAGPRLIDTCSHLFPRSVDALGFDLEADGFHVVLGRELPGLVRAEIARLVGQLCARNDLAPSELAAFVLHPGGRRILDAIEDELKLRPDQLAPSREVLRDYGNVSSATVLFVLHEWMTRCPPEPGTHGLLGAFGPGFSCELGVLRWS